MRNTSLSPRLMSICLYTQSRPVPRLSFPPTCDSKWTRPFNTTTILLWGLRTDCEPVLDGTCRVVRRVYASGWAATGACSVLAVTMIDTYTAADAILTTGHFGDGSDTEVAPVQHRAYSEMSGGRRSGGHHLLNTRTQLSWVT